MVQIKGAYFRKRLIRNLFKKTLLLTGNLEKDVSVGVRFVKEDEIRELNKQHRGIDRLQMSFLSLCLILRKGKS